ncbi:hypothetical protein A6A04_03420 [Paramagnetospirillum marisnigri]|uniref:BF1531-like N-terminal domain-containing protein n=1 Tax=Paramagnetospirillum marisnigri TaxID=1285242 RepID=A0A178MLX7_9PROT|nr:HAD-IIIC family phosphatase [Paramagnetospirillum marisnigri]OAN49177.1 hypothetical protein A6A04_03420 [Paramagnetospirillum marisnigri]
MNWADVKVRAAQGDARGAFEALKSIARPGDDFVTQRKYAKLLDKLPKDGLELRPLKLALLATSTTDHLADILRLWLALEGFDAEIHQPPFGQAAQSVLDPDSELYRFQPDMVWFFTSWRDVRLDAMPGADKAAVEAAVAGAVAETAGLWRALQQRLSCLIVQNNADIPSMDVFGHFEANVAWSRRSLLRRYNLALAEALPNAVTLFDLEHVSGCWGKDAWAEHRYWYHSKHAFAFDAIGQVAFQFARLAGAAKGLAKKCLVLDLDNTLWGGVIGDDGVEGIRLGNGADGEAFADFQDYVRALKARGIILTVCSKNEEANAREPFERHPDMRLSLDDVAVFRANWDNKADNIRLIAETLNIGLDSMVFVDDNPAERSLVRDFLPMVTIPELPEDPTLYAATLHAERLFETLAFSDEDAVRNDYYRANASRQELRSQYADLGEFQRGLEMTSEVAEIDEFRLPRSAQLINKSNQFHLTGTRHGEAEILDMLAETDWIGRCFGLKDRFGDNGLISVVLLRRDGDSAHVDTWVMSCRVLGRGMEEFIVNEMAMAARAAGCTHLLGRYVPSKKNKLVAGLYQRMGFIKLSDAGGETLWRLDLDGFLPLKTFIARE